MWFIGVEVEQETRAPPPKKNPGSPPEYKTLTSSETMHWKGYSLFFAHLL